MPTWAARALWYAVLCLLAAGLAAYCEVNFVFATLEFESNQPWQFDLLVWVLIVLAATLVLDISRVLGRLREDAARGPGFWLSAKLFLLVSLAIVGVLCFMVGRSAYAHWELRFLRKNPAPVEELMSNYEERYLRAADATAAWIRDSCASTSTDSTSGAVLPYHDCDPEDNPTLIVVERPPDWTKWQVYEPEDGLIVASLHAGWAGVGAVQGAKVILFDGTELDEIDTFDVQLMEQYHRVVDGWALLDSEVRVIGRWEDY